MIIAKLQNPARGFVNSFLSLTTDFIGETQVVILDFNKYFQVYYVVN